MSEFTFTAVAERPKRQGGKGRAVVVTPFDAKVAELAVQLSDSVTESESVEFTIPGSNADLAERLKTLLSQLRKAGRRAGVTTSTHVGERTEKSGKVVTVVTFWTRPRITRSAESKNTAE